MSANLLFISDDQVQEHLDLQELMEVMKAALISLSEGAVIQPLRSAIFLAEQKAWFGVMPAIYRDVIGTKLVTVFPRNSDHQMPTHQALVQLFDRETGSPLAVLDGRSITAWRTAAVSALATDELAKPDASALAILGSGVQARTHYTMLNLVRHFEDVRVWSRTPAHAHCFAEEISARVTSAEDAVRGADVVVTVTHTSEPVLHGEWLAEGTHVNAVGSVGLHARELDAHAIDRSAVVVESAEAALRESGEIAQSGVPIYAELGEVLSGRKAKPRARNTVYKSLGVAVEDVAAARMIYARVMGKSFHA